MMKTGVCYYPEHWPEERWGEDALHMKRLGLSVVRVGEFAWSRLQDRDGTLHLDWLERAIDTLHEAGLSVVLGTPTATPPRWMLDRYPDMLAVDSHGRLRNFGSRRHYCFSHQPYLQECEKIVETLASRFGNHPGIIAWQTDNEYGCHSTSISYSSHALTAFRLWCKENYKDIQHLNTAWGNVFWSMEYDSFDHIGLPTGTVTESNPAHQLAFWRFSSDQIARFNKAQVQIIRRLSPGRDILHNFMGNFVEFDHHQVSKDLDIAAWDNYPLGFLTRDGSDAEDQARFLRTGHPDSSAFHHDLYRGCCGSRWWVMEQQPGPVNWAPYNPSPLPGMVRLWGWEAFAHGAEVMSYFRWRQAPFAQEQTHTGLLLSNAEEDIAAQEVATLNAELQQLAEQAATDSVHSDSSHGSDEKAVSSSPKVESEVAIIFSYAGIAIQDIQLPGGETYSPLEFCQRLYSACRQWGANVDIVAPTASLAGYKLILVCTSTEDSEQLSASLQHAHKTGACSIVLFPGTASRSNDYTIPDTLPPGHLQSLMPVKVVRSESLPANERLEAMSTQGISYCCGQWRECVQSTIEPQYRFADGWGFDYAQNGIRYINAIPNKAALIALAGEWLTSAGIDGHDLGPYLRTQRIGSYRLAFNFGAQPVELDKQLGKAFDFDKDTVVLMGSRTLKQADMALWLVRQSK